MRLFLFFLFLPSLFFCRRSLEETAPSPYVPMPESIDLLALGDSYTKGESVDWAKNFPNQLADSLRNAGFAVAGLKIVAQTGWRTDNLQNALANQSAVLADSVFSLVTLCIGVNNQYQNANFETYKKQFEELLQYALARVGGKKNRVLVLSIPDWAFTPYGQSFGNPLLISQRIDEYNAANQAIAAAFGVVYVDVTGISRQGLDNPALVALDGLHPSALQYTEWVRLLLPQARAALNQ